MSRTALGDIWSDDEECQLVLWSVGERVGWWAGGLVGLWVGGLLFGLRCW